ncbi:hypothetical protein [Lachnoclostridium sp.]|uniref:hypothetical protein n=1 Tax=Lachnoclostridium sp. TaxID=2028282 RepID=UPI0028A02A32|nr:hypothetical protein [Lachnoclostridium sp.]
MRKQSMENQGEVVQSESALSKEVTRRQAIKAIGAGGLLIACAPFLFGKTASAASSKDKDVKNVQDVLSLTDVESLKRLSKAERKDGMIVNLLGYYKAGDGGQKTLVYLSKSKEQENGGTVHRPNDGGGAWHVLHDGIGQFRWFGIFDESIPADHALDSLVNDESFHRIEASSDLLLIKRHVFHRSNLELDFQNHTMYTYGAENADRDNPFAAMMFFQGVKVGNPITVTLPYVKNEKGTLVQAEFSEDSDYLYVGNNKMFAEHEWYYVETDVRPMEQVPGRLPIGGGSSDKEIQKLLRVTKVGKSASDTEYVAFNYLNAWPLKSKRKITYQKIEPVFHVHIKNLKFEGQGHSDTTGTSPVAHEFCVDCNITNIQATKVFWPLNLRRYCTQYEVRDCLLKNPEEVSVGGTGYLIQQIGCLYGSVINCRAHNVRHLNDFTGCAYSLVENCHCTGDENGAFVTHGQYDHDLTYIGNSGFLSFANSALNAKASHTWGGFHKRIVVKKHQAPRVVFENKMNRVIDMTLEDCYVYRNTERYGGNGGSIWANIDGLVMRNCVLMGPLALGEDSSMSHRPTIIEGCTIHMLDGHYLTRHRGSTYEVERDITFKNCVFKNIGQNFIVKGETIRFYDCHFYADSNAPTSRLNVESKHVIISGGGFHNVCFAFDKGGTTTEAVGDQSLEVCGGAVMEGNNASGTLIDIKNNAHIRLDFSRAEFAPGYQMKMITQTPEDGTASIGTLSLQMQGTTLKDTELRISESSLGKDSYIMVQSCLLKNSRLDLPSGSQCVVMNNLML